MKDRTQDNKLWLWTAVEHFKEGILGWVIGDRSAETFVPLWNLVRNWKCYFYVTDGWKVYPKFIPDDAQIVSKTADPPRMYSRWNAAASLT